MHAGTNSVNFSPIFEPSPAEASFVSRSVSRDILVVLLRDALVMFSALESKIALLTLKHKKRVVRTAVCLVCDLFKKGNKGS
jgi:hypothetical protein